MALILTKYKGEMSRGLFYIMMNSYTFTSVTVVFRNIILCQFLFSVSYSKPDKQHAKTV